MNNRIYSLILVLILLALAIPVRAAEQTVLDVSKGAVVIGEGTVSGYSPSGRKVTTPDLDGYVLTGSTSNSHHNVTISGGSHAITLRDLTIRIGSAPEFGQEPPFAPEKAAIGIAGGHVELTLEGSSTLQSGDNHGGINLSEGASLTVTAESTGSLRTTGGIDGAGIGTGYEQTCGDIAIHGGTITAFGSDDSAGIGCGWSGTCGNITITGGTVHASSHEGSGIGGGGAYVSDSFQTFCGDITISGGTVTAKAGGLAAGIGSGMYETCGSITISGGIVTANSGFSAAGIGGGWTGRVGTITISGGEITAMGKSQGAGIGCGGAGVGSGYESTCTGIIMTGGIVHTTGGSYCPGIGSAWGGNCGSLIITGGSLTTLGGEYSDALGNAMEGICGSIILAGGQFAEGDPETNTVYGHAVVADAVVTVQEGAHPYHVTGHLHTPLDGGTITEPTCTEEGYTTHICALCTMPYTADPIAAVGHINEAVITEPTCTEEGYTTYLCTRCGESSVADVLPALGHDYVSEITAPTHTDEGYTTHTCTRCEHSFTDSPVPATCPSGIYSDVSEGNWYHEAVDFVTARGIMTGMGDGTFAPNETTNRAMMATIFYRLAGSPGVEGLTEPFRDVTPANWYYDSVVWAYNAGIIQGTSPSAFQPLGLLQRMQMVTMFHRFAGSPEADTTVLDTFDDGAAVWSYARVPFAWAIQEGLVQGMEGNTLQPKANSTRAQIATILMRDLQA